MWFMKPNPKPTILALTIALISLSSCLHKAYYQNPVQANIGTYHAVPVASDSVKSAFYLSSSISLGGMNENLRDNVLSLQLGTHRSHVLNRMRLYYGASAAVGSYNVKRYSSYGYDTYYLDTVSINRKAGTKFWGAYGAYGGISASAPMGRRGEWRYIGVEGSIFREFGEYRDFRKELPNRAATTIDKKNYMGSLGINTELIFKGRSRKEFGMKFAFGSYLRTLQYSTDSSGYSYGTHDNLFYFSNAYHFTRDKTTTYVQLNIATHAANVQFGVNYRF